jgi:hypothetical protein
MRVSKLALVVLAASLSGCMAWYHPTKNESEFNQDKYTCLQQSAQAFPVVMQTQTYGTGHQTPSQTTCQTYSFGQTNCTTTPGTYYPPQTSSVDVNEGNRNAAFSSCMNANGWSLRRKQ